MHFMLFWTLYFFKIFFIVLYWFPLLSTNIEVADTIFWHLFESPKLSEQSLPHQWRSFDNWNNSISQKVQNSESKSERKQKWKWSHSPKSESGHFHQETHEGSTIKKFNWILQFSSPLAPPPLLLPCPKCLLTEAWKASSFGPVIVLIIHYPLSLWRPHPVPGQCWWTKPGDGKKTGEPEELVIVIVINFQEGTHSKT